jgi:hypothetical protein
MARRMKIKNLFYIVFISMICRAMEIESEFKKIKIDSDLFNWDLLPQDIKGEILKYFTNWKVNKESAQALAESLTESVKKYRSELSKTLNKDITQKITNSYNNFLGQNLTEEDFKNLNQYIFDSLGKDQLPKDLISLVKLLIRLNKGLSLNSNFLESND